MFLVAGLGNPGEQYERTPHNLGFLTVDLLAQRHGIRITRPEAKALVGHGEIAGRPVLLAKPQTFMNLSGTSIRPLLEKYELHPKLDLVLVYDELDLPWGSIKIKPEGSAAGHNGVISTIEKLGTKEFTRVRIGAHPGRPLRDGAEYLLTRFNRAQETELEELLGFAADAVTSIIADGVAKSMAKFNRRAVGSKEEA